MKYSIILALALLSSPAYATTPPNPCGNHGNNCNPDPPTTPSNPSQTQTQQTASEANAGAVAGAVGVGHGGNANAQGGAGGQGGTGISGANASNGDQSTSVRNANDLSQNAFSGANNTTDVSNSAGSSSIGGDQSLNNENSASADGSGNSDTAVTIGGDSYNTEGSSFVYQAAMPPAPPVFGPSSVATVSYGQCGPYKAVESAPVNGVYLGMVRKHSIPLGRTDRIVAYNGESFKQKQFPDGRWYLEGQQAIRTTTVLNVSGSRQVSLGGYGTNGGGQAGAGGGSSMQQLVSTIDLEPCVAYIQQAVEQLPVIEFKEPRMPRG